MMMDRRAFLRLAALSGAGAMLNQSLVWAQDASTAAPVMPTMGGTSHFTRRITMARFPEKRSLILLTDRPPQLETPISILKHDITPNDAFFVRWHESGIPTTVDLGPFRLNVGGHVQSPLSLSVEQLKSQFEPVSFQAVAQCSGNSRGYFQPRVAGGQWGNGAVGNAKWTGVRLKDLLAKAVVKPDPVDVTFDGLDEPPISDTPKFVKSLEFAHANNGEVIVAYAMNDAPLPMLNGFPLRLVVPGWFATYWVKSLHQINVLAEKFDGFWMTKAYRIPATPDGNESPTHLSPQTVPITRHTVRSLIVAPLDRQSLKAGDNVDVQGVAFDSGQGITQVEVSTDGGISWADAKLDPQADRYAWRRFHHSWTPADGHYTILSRATNAKGETQVTSQWNRSGYQRNVIERIQVTVA